MVTTSGREARLNIPKCCRQPVVQAGSFDLLNKFLMLQWTCCRSTAPFYLGFQNSARVVDRFLSWVVATVVTAVSVKYGQCLIIAKWRVVFI